MPIRSWVGFFCLCLAPLSWGQKPDPLETQKDGIADYLNRQQNAFSRLKDDITKKKEKDPEIVSQFLNYPSTAAVTAQAYLAFFSINHFRDRSLVQLIQNSMLALFPETLTLSEGKKTFHEGRFLFKNNSYSWDNYTTPYSFDLQAQITPEASSGRFFITADYELSSNLKFFERRSLIIWDDLGRSTLTNDLIDLTQSFESLVKELSPKLQRIPNLREYAVSFFNTLKTEPKVAALWPKVAELPQFLIDTSATKSGVFENWLKDGFASIIRQRYLKLGGLFLIGGGLYYWLDSNTEEQPVAKLLGYLHRGCINPKTYDLRSTACVANVLDSYDAADASKAIGELYQFTLKN